MQESQSATTVGIRFSEDDDSPARSPQPVPAIATPASKQSKSPRNKGGLQARVGFKQEPDATEAGQGAPSRRAVVLFQPEFLGGVSFEEPEDDEVSSPKSAFSSIESPRLSRPSNTRFSSRQSGRRSSAARRQTVALIRRHNGRNSNRRSMNTEVWYGGILSDYLMAFFRQRTKLRAPDNPDKLYRWYRKELGCDSDSYSSSEGEENQDEEQERVHTQGTNMKLERTIACRIAHRDKLIQILQKELLSFWSHAEERHHITAAQATARHQKGRRTALEPLPYNWMPEHDPDDEDITGFQVEAESIVGCHREARCLEAEINHLLLRRRLLSGPSALPDSEDLEKKRQSQQNFWKLYHIDENKLPEGFGSARGDSPRSPSPRSPAPKTRLPLIARPTGGPHASGRQEATENDEQLLQLPKEFTNRSGSPDSKHKSSSKRPGSRLRPNSKQQTPSSKAKLAAAAAAALETNLSRTTATRMLVGHRNHIHQQRIRRNHSETADEFESSRSVERHNRFLQSWMKDSVPEPSSSDDDEVERPPTQGPYFDIGGFLDPVSRQLRSKQMKGWTARYKQVPDKSGSRGARHGQMTSFAALPSVPMPATFGTGMRSSASDGALHHLRMTGGDSPDRLPPLFGLSGPFKVPWREEGKSQQKVLAKAGNEAQGSAAQQYINACRKGGVVPTPTAVQMVEKGALRGAEKKLFDDDLLALAAMVPQLDRLNSVDLSGNASLSDAVVAQFLNTFFSWSVAGSLENLDLSYCKGLARSSITVGISLLTDADGLYRLLHLNLSGVFIPSVNFLPLCTAVRNHAALKTLQLADTGLGQHPAVRQCVLELFQMPRLELVDLSWNSFPIEVFELIGNALCNNNVLKTLQFACCSGFHSAAGESPIVHLLEHLSRNTSLKLLDISTNQIDSEGALVLEDALEYHAGITELIISQNPLGVEGLRSFLRLLSQDTSGLMYFDCNSCAGHPGIHHSFFNATDPSGRYELDLGHPYGRAVLRMLYKTCERFGLNADRAFLDAAYVAPRSTKASNNARASASGTRPPFVPTTWKHPKVKDASDLWCVPTVGVFSFTFTIDDALVQNFTTEDPDGKPSAIFRKATEHHARKHHCTFAARGTVAQTIAGVRGSTSTRLSYEATDLSSLQLQKGSTWRARLPPLLATKYLEQINDFMRIKPGFRKIVPLLAQFASFKKQARDQLLLVDALSHDFHLTFAHIHQLCRTCSRTVTVLPKLLQCVSGGPNRYLTQTLAANLEEYLNVFCKCQRYLLFNPENATGHYLLDLSNPSNFAVAEQLRLLDRWEAMMARRRGCNDFSMHGNWSGIRNASHNSNETIQNMTTWHLPPTGRLELDYSSWRRPPTFATWLDNATWSTLLLELAVASCRSQDKITALHFVSDQFYLTAVQLRELLGAVSKATDRISVITTFAFRLVDPQNMKLVRARLGDESEKLEVQYRLGILPTLSYFQPEESQFRLELGIYEGRMAASLAIHLAVKERLENIRQPSLQFPDENYYNFTMGTPVSWEHFDNLPRSGNLRFRYVCAPEDRKVKLRRELGVKYGGWRCDPNLDDTIWWSGLSEAPDAVLEFMYCIVRQFSDVYTCFTKLGQIGNWSGSVSMSQLQNSLDRSNGFTKFMKNPDKVKAAFRYLDPDESGEVSIHEWGALHQLWKELQLSLLEFLQFVDRTFNGNFNLVWEELDADGSGAVDQEEWAEAVQFIGYFGESTPIFNYLCDPQLNMITEDAWAKTSTMWSKRDEIRQRILEEDS